MNRKKRLATESERRKARAQGAQAPTYVFVDDGSTADSGTSSSSCSDYSSSSSSSSGYTSDSSSSYSSDSGSSSCDSSSF